MDTTEVMTIATIIGTVFSFLGITGIDANVISGAVTGIISLVTIGTAVWAHFAHKSSVAASA